MVEVNNLFEKSEKWTIFVSVLGVLVVNDNFFPK